MLVYFINWNEKEQIAVFTLYKGKKKICLALNKKKNLRINFGRHIITLLVIISIWRIEAKTEENKERRKKFHKEKM